MNEPYEVTKMKLSSLANVGIAAYSETSIVNITNESIVIIDNQNNKTIIPPSNFSNVCENVVVIYYRKGVCATATSNGTPCVLNGFTVKLDKYRLRNSPIYVKEIDKLVCTEEQAAHATHPYANVSYSDAMHEAIDELAKVVNEAPGFKILANDPTGSMHTLYTILDNHVVSIPVTNKSADTPTMTIVSTREGKMYDESFDLKELLNGTTNTMKFPGRVIPWVTTSEINAKEIAKMFSWITPEYLAELKNKIQQESKRNLDATIAQMDADKGKLEVKITTLEAECKRLELERDDFKTKYTTMKNDRQTNLDGMTRMYDIMKARNDYDMSNGNLQMNGYKLQMTQQESQFKLWHLALMAALPILGLMAMKMFEGAFKK